MDPYGFERLSQRVLDEYGVTQVEVTKKSGDGGIDGTGKLKINGIFSFNVAFQCKFIQPILLKSVSAGLFFIRYTKIFEKCFYISNP